MATNQAQNGIAAPIEALFASDLCPCLSSCCQSETTEGFLQPVGAAPRKDDRALGVVQRKSFAHTYSFYRKNDVHAG